MSQNVDKTAPNASREGGAGRTPEEGLWRRGAPGWRGLRILGLSVAIVVIPVALYWCVVMDSARKYDQERAFRRLAEIEQAIEDRLDIRSVFESTEFTPWASGRNIFYNWVPEETRNELLETWKPYVDQARTNGSASFGRHELFELCLEDMDCAPAASDTTSFEGCDRTAQRQVVFQRYCGHWKTMARYVRTYSAPISQWNPNDSARRFVNMLALASAAPGANLVTRTDQKLDNACQAEGRPAAALMFIPKPVALFVYNPCIDGQRKLQAGTAALLPAVPPDFEHLYLGDAHGQILAEVGRRTGADDSRHTHVPIPDRGRIMTSLSRVATNGSRPDSSASPEAVPAGEEHSWSETVAGRPTQFFMRRVVLPYPMFVAKRPQGKDQDEAEPIADLVLVGSRAESPVTAILGETGHYTRLWAFLMICVAVAAWPLIRLALWEPMDSLARGESKAIGVGAVLIAGLMGVAVAAFAAHETNLVRLRSSAQELARKVEERMLSDVMDSARRLADDDAGTKWVECTGFDAAEGNRPCPQGPVSCVATRDGDPPEALPWFATRINVDATGRVQGPTRSNYGCRPRPETIDLQNRQYFDRLRKGLAWTVRERAVVVQRLFNRVDGAKLTQMAIPITSSRSREPSAGPSEFAGIVSADSLMLPLTAWIPSGPLGFLVFEEATGTVVFHANDERALLENVFTETEGSRGLRAAAEQRQGADIRFRYGGVDHGAHYLPVEGMPWGVVTFFPLSAAGESIFDAGVLAGFGYLALTGACFVVVGLPLAAIGRKPTWMWPQWRLRQAYPLCAVLLVLLATAQVTIAWSSPGELLPIVLMMVCMVHVCGGLAFLAAHPPSQEPWRRRAFLAAQAALAFLLVAGLYNIASSLETHPAAAGWATAGVAGVALMMWGLRLLWNKTVQDAANGPSPEDRNPWRRPFSLSGFPLAAGLASEHQRRPDSEGGRQLRWYRWSFGACFCLHLAILGVLPGSLMFERALMWRLEAESARGLSRAAEGYEQRVFRIRRELERLVFDHTTRRQKYPDPWTAAAYVQSPGIAIQWMGSREHVGLTVSQQYAPPRRVALMGEPPTWLTVLWDGLGTVLSTHARWLEARAGNGRDALVALEAKTPTGRRITVWTPRSPASWLAEVPVLSAGAGVVEVPSWAGLRVAVVAVLAGLALAVLVRFVSRRLLWLDVPWPRRFAPEPPEPFDIPDPESHARLVLARLGTDMASEPVPMSDEKLLGLLSLPDTLRIDACSDGAEAVMAAAKAPSEAVVVARVDVALAMSRDQGPLLTGLEQLLRHPKVSVFLTCDVSPIYRALRPDAYPGFDEKADPLEREALQMRWAGVFGKFRKHYLIPKDPEGPGPDESSFEIRELIDRECRPFWPKLLGVRRELRALASARPDLTPKDVLDYVQARADALFARQWKLCTRDERLMLFEMSLSRVPNPLGAAVMEHLLRRGWVVCEPNPRLASRCLANFVASAEPAATFCAWSERAAVGPWRTLRVPLFLLLLVMLAWIGALAGDAVQKVSALISAVLAMLANLGRLTGYARGAPLEDK